MNDEPGNTIQEVPQEPEKKARAQRRLFTGHQKVDYFLIDLLDLLRGRPLTGQQKLKFFLIGLLGWWLVNILLWRILVPLPLSQLSPNQGEGVLFCLTPILLSANTFVLILMAFINRWVALGIVTAFAVNLVVSLVLGLVFNGVCWIPFTAPIPW